jgi:predicted ester cyclase
MRKNLAAAVALPLLPFTASPASAAMTEASARALVAPFYDALNAAPGKDVASLITQDTSADWVSCSGNDTCLRRDAVAQRIAALDASVPDLKWEIKELLVAGNRIIVRGEASGTPAGNFMGVAHGGRSFTLMSLDVHTVENGKIVRSYHLEDWMGAVRQLAAK